MNASPTSRAWVALLLCALLAGCAHRPPREAAEQLLRDGRFAAASEPIDKASVFALSDAMQRFLASEFSTPAALRDPRRALVEALNDPRRLALSYDAGRTRTAAQAFDARAGNCLSLVVMTAALARQLGLPVSFRSVRVEELYTRSGDLTVASGHINLVLGQPSARKWHGANEATDLTIDFLPPEEVRGQSSDPLREETIVAMYLNNRAAEALADGRLSDAYWWAREALLQDAAFDAAANTLAVVYLRSGLLPEAETALRRVLAQDPDHTSALSNLVVSLQRAGRATEAAATAERLARIQPYPPFHFFELGRQAMAAGDYGRARDLFARELRRQPFQHEVHFWAALAHWRLGHNERAAEHLRLAMENSLTRGAHDLYAAKLDRLRALRLQ
ncbi:MAG: tetratricopeptide repeat protein [Rubrivivax sp.]|nr:tetratricopeptide repeat protein [Rubrivivax sp.]